MSDDIDSGSVTDCHLRSFSDLRQPTQQCRAAPRRKSKQTQPEKMSSPTNTQLRQNIRIIMGEGG